MPTFFVNTDDARISNAFLATLGAAPGSTYLAQIKAFGLVNSVNAMIAATGKTTAADLATTITGNLGLTGAAATAGQAYLTSVTLAGASSTWGANLISTLDLFTTLQNDATYGTAASAYVARINSAVAYSAVAANNSTDLTTLAAAVGSAGSTGAGSTFTLTTAADILSPTQSVAASKTTEGNDSIFGLTFNSLTAADILNGGGGNDSLTADYDLGAAAIATVAPVLTSIENVVIKNTGTDNTAGRTFTFSAANSTGLSKITFSDITAGATAQTFVASSLASGTTLGIANSVVAGADVYTFQYTDAALAGSADTVTLEVSNATTATGAVTIQNSTAATGSNDGAETVVIKVSNTSATATSTLGSLAVSDGTNARMNTLQIDATGRFAITGAIDFEGANTAATTGTVNAAGSTANVTLNLSNGESIVYTGGSASDSVTLGTGNDNITGGAGNDTVTLAIASLTSADTIALGDGTRDTIVYSDVTALNSTGVSATALAALNRATGVEVIGAGGNMTAIDADYFTQTILRKTAASTAALTVSNIDGDTVVMSAGITEATAGAAEALTLGGKLPGATATLELSGAAAVAISASDGAAGNNALVVNSGITTVNIVSNTSSATAVTNSLTHAAITTATHTVDNASASSFNLTGSTNFTITSGATAGFTNAVNFNASAFTGVLTITGSASADSITGGTGSDVITGGAGNDQLTGGAGNDSFVMLTATIASGSDTITDFEVGAGKDTLDIGYLTIPASLTTATMTGASAIATNTIYNVDYAAAIGSTDFRVAGATGFNLLFGAGKAFGTTVATTDDFMIIVRGTDKTVILAVENAAATTLVASDIDAMITLTGVTNSSTFSALNFI